MKKSTIYYFLSIVIGGICFSFLPGVIRGGINTANNIVFFLSAVASAIFATVGVVIRLKEMKSKQIIDQAAVHDAIWNMEQMKLDARSIFYKVQSAWDSRDAASIMDYTTRGFSLFFQKQLNNISSPDKEPAVTFDIEETRIICCQDYLDNDRDKFVAYIKGNSICDGSGKEFSSILHFIRKDNEWLLYKINYGPGIWTLLSEKNVEEG